MIGCALISILLLGQYVPDFMAHISSTDLRFLCIFLPHNDDELSDATAANATSNARSSIQKYRRRGSQTRKRQRSSFIDRSSSHNSQWWQWQWFWGGAKNQSATTQEVQSPLATSSRLETAQSHIELQNTYKPPDHSRQPSH